MDFVGLGAGEDVVGNRKFTVPGVEVHDVIRAVSRDVIENFFGQIAVGVNQGAAKTICNIAQEEILEERGFASAGLAYEIDVLAAVGMSKRKRFCPAPNFAIPQDCFLVVIKRRHAPEQTSTPPRNKP